jgi:hypothetical protein
MVRLTLTARRAGYSEPDERKVQLVMLESGMTSVATKRELYHRVRRWTDRIYVIGVLLKYAELLARKANGWCW